MQETWFNCNWNESYKTYKRTLAWSWRRKYCIQIHRRYLLPSSSLLLRTPCFAVFFLGWLFHLLLLRSWNPGFLHSPGTQRCWTEGEGDQSPGLPLGLCTEGGWCWTTLCFSIESPGRLQFHAFPLPGVLVGKFQRKATSKWGRILGSSLWQRLFTPRHTCSSSPGFS